MTENKVRQTRRRQSNSARALPVMSELELAKLGGGAVAYIKILSSDEAHRMFPAVDGLPKGIPLFSLHAADGTPLALTDTRQAAVGHAMEDELSIASIH